MSDGYVIVGANLAGGRAAEALRDAGFDGPVVLIGEELDRPYERPPLSKEVLRGETPREDVFLRPDEWYAEHEIELRLGARVAHLDPDGSVTLADGDSIPFEGCLIATGGRVRRLDLPGADLDGIRYLRTLGDATSIAAALTERPRVVVVGAGFIGAEVAASARMLGCEVTVLEIAPVPLGRVLGEDIGEIYAQIHRDHGVDLRLGEGIERYQGGSRVEAVVTSSGTEIPADLVVVGVGIDPADELAREAGIDCDNGIVVDERCRTSAPKVYAAGDVASRPDAFSGHRIRVEHFQNAQNQGAAAGRAMLGADDAFEEVPWFWSDQYDVNLQMLGEPGDDAERVVRGSFAERRFTALYVRGEHVVAAIAMNRGADIAAARRLIERRVAVDLDALGDEDVSMKSLLRS